MQHLPLFSNNRSARASCTSIEPLLDQLTKRGQRCPSLWAILAPRRAAPTGCQPRGRLDTVPGAASDAATAAINALAAAAGTVADAAERHELATAVGVIAAEQAAGPAPAGLGLTASAGSGLQSAGVSQAQRTHVAYGGGGSRLPVILSQSRALVDASQVRPTSSRPPLA